MNKQARMSMFEMTQYRERLMKQKEFLADILSKIEKQILALQVERLHLRNTLLGTDYPGRDAVSTALAKNMKTESVTENPANLADQQLDLSVPSFLNNSEEENEDEESIVDDKEFLNKYKFVNDNLQL